MRRFLLTSLMALAALQAPAAERWETLPPTPTPIATDRSGEAQVNGVSIHYAIYGQGSPVIFLHGGLANTDYWGNQVLAVAARHTVILMDSRGHGRSTRDARPYGYDLMADDVVALMDSLKIAKADIVGWSDGGILGIDLAMRHKDRVGKVFAFAANTATSGVKDGVEKNPTFAAYIERAGHEYEAHSATPKEYDAFVDQISKMWAEQPNWSDAQLKGVAWDSLQDCTLSKAEACCVKAVRAQWSEALAWSLNFGPEIVARERDVIPFDGRDMRQQLIGENDAVITHVIESAGEVGRVPQDDGVHDQV